MLEVVVDTEQDTVVPSSPSLGEPSLLDHWNLIDHMLTASSPVYNGVTLDTRVCFQEVYHGSASEKKRLLIPFGLIGNSSPEAGEIVSKKRREKNPLIGCCLTVLARSGIIEVCNKRLRYALWLSEIDETGCAFPDWKICIFDGAGEAVNDESILAHQEVRDTFSTYFVLDSVKAEQVGGEERLFRTIRMVNGENIIH